MKKELPKIATIFLITVGVVIWGLNYIFIGSAPKSKAAIEERISYVFDPALINVTGDFTTSVRAKPSVDMTIRGYQFEVLFDKSKVQFKSIQYKTGTVSSGLGDDDLKKDTINSNGKIKVVGEIQSAPGQVMLASQNTEMVLITFTSSLLQPSSITTGEIDAIFKKIKLDDPNMYSLIDIMSAGQAILSINSSDTEPTPTITPGGPTLTPTPTGTSGNANLKIKLKFQGIIKKPATDALNKLSTKVKLLNETTGQETSYQAVDFKADDSGIWSGNTSFNIDVNAKYVLFAKGPYHLQKKICDALPTETAGGTYHCAKGKITLNNGDNDLNLSGVTLLSGDLPDQDGSITAYDTSFIYNNLGKENDKCDVNRDGKCDTQDYSLVIAALSVKNDEQ